MLGNLLKLLRCLGRLASLSTRLALVGSLASLDFLQSRLSLRRPKVTLLSSLLSDIVQRSTNHSALDLVGAAGALLGGGFRKTLLVKTAPGLCPDQLGGLFALHRQAVGLAGSHKDGLAVAADHELAIAGVNSVLRESAQFSCQQVEMM